MTPVSPELAMQRIDQLNFNRMRPMKIELRICSTTTAVAITLAAVAGCGKNDIVLPPVRKTAARPAVQINVETPPAAPETTAASTSQPELAPTITPPADVANAPEVKPTATPLTATDQATVNALSVALREFRSVNLRFPKDLNELVTAGLLPKAPEPPNGKKFAIDQRNFQIVVVDQ